MKYQDAIAIGTLPRGGEIKLDIGHVVRPISKAEYDTYIVLDLFLPYESKDPQYVWVDRAGPTGLYFGIKMWEEDKRYAIPVGECEYG